MKDPCTPNAACESTSLHHQLSDDASHELDFSHIVHFHVSEAVHALVAEHDRIMGELWRENQKLKTRVCELNPSEVDEMWNSPSAVLYASHPSQRSLDEKNSKTLPETATHSVNGFDSCNSICINETDNSCTVNLKRLIRSGRFDSIVGGIIVLNTLVMSLELEYSGRKFHEKVIDGCVECEVRTESFEVFFVAMEHFFTGAFAVELILRVGVQGLGYLRQISNIIDAIIVIVSMADSWMPLGGGGNVLGSVAVLRLMRLLRLAKVLRVVRVMKAFKSLRVLVSAVVNSVGALGWSMTLLFVLMLLGAIFMAQVIQPFMEETSDKELQKFIWSRFGTWTNSMITVFEITMAPGGFIAYRRLYEEVHPLFGAFCMLYVCLVTFAVVRVITAMFLKTTLSASDSEEQASAREKSKEWSEYVRTFEKMTDTAGTGAINLNEIHSLLSTDQFSRWMDEAGLSPYEIVRIFNSLDRGQGEVLFADFEMALQHMLGLPRAADVVINLYETRNIMDRVTRMEAALNDDRHQQVSRANQLLTRALSVGTIATTNGTMSRRFGRSSNISDMSKETGHYRSENIAVI